jgi:hypothetical protein
VAAAVTKREAQRRRWAVIGAQLFVLEADDDIECLLGILFRKRGGPAETVDRGQRRLIESGEARPLLEGDPLDPAASVDPEGDEGGG